MLIGMGMSAIHRFLSCISFYSVECIQCSIKQARGGEGWNESMIRIVRRHSYPLSSCFAIPFFSVSEWFGMSNGINGENEIVHNVELNGWMKGRLLSWTRIWCGLWRKTWISDALVMLWSSDCILGWKNSYLELLSNNLEYLSKHVVDNTRQSNWMPLCWNMYYLLFEWFVKANSHYELDEMRRVTVKPNSAPTTHSLTQQTQLNYTH